MSEFLTDIDRPDVHGVPPKMSFLCARAQQVVTGPPYLHIWTADNLLSCLWIKGSFDTQETWEYGIYENSRCFSFMISPCHGQRYYTNGDPVTVEMTRGKRTAPFRKYTGAPEKALQKIAAWIQQGL